MGGADAISVVIRLTLVQLETPDDMRGRVSAVNSLFVTMSNQIGDFRAGVVANFIGAVPAVLVGGIGTLLVVLLCIRAVPRALSGRGIPQEENRVTMIDPLVPAKAGTRLDRDWISASRATSSGRSWSSNTRRDLACSPRCLCPTWMRR